MRLRTSRPSPGRWHAVGRGRRPLLTSPGRPHRVVPVAAAVLAVLIAGCAVGSSAGAPTASPSGKPGDGAQPVIGPIPVSAAEFARLPRATTFARIVSAPRDADPFAAASGLVVHPRRALVLYAGPGQRPVAVLPTSELGDATWVPVVRVVPGWDQVLLPSRPNRATGWIFTGGAAAFRLRSAHSPYLIRIKVGARTLSVERGRRQLGTWTVAVGAPGTPTPTGRTFLLALIAPTQPSYSPLILPLGVHSTTLSSFGGGPGIVGLHGWPDPAVFGQAISHGCVRVPAAALRVLSRVPLGTLVVITS
jgi:lipoprotein-anchoring transpeptidase ErfK/SrfK